MRFKIVVFLLFAAAFLSYAQQYSQNDDWYQGKPINSITFSGLKNISMSELEALMNPYKGRIFNDDIFWEIQGKLYALEYFESIETSTIRANPSGTEVILRFTVIERPVISRINFAGNSGLRRNELLDTISSKASDVLNQAKIRSDINAIINKYMEKGYPNATVTAEETQSGEASVTLTFRITEGDKISISRIEFQGNNRFSSNTLRNQLSLKAKSLIINDGAFQEAKLVADREAVAKYYHDRGFIYASVRDVTRTYDATDKGTNLILTFFIDEGGEYRFGGVTFEGNRIFSTEQLSKLITSKTGDIVNMTRLEMDLQRVADLYFENGYINNSIVRTPERDTQNNTLSYKISIVERSRAYIENIVVIGNEKTKTDVIMREIPLEPGDVFSKTKVMTAMRNLYNLQYFSMIIPDTYPGSTENMMDLVFTVEEQMTTDIQFGLTFSGSADPETFPISGLIEWNDRNVAGSGNELGVKVNSSVIDSSTFSIRYLHRWVFGLPLSLGTDFSADYSRRFATMNNQSPIFYGDEDNAYPDGFYSREEYARNNYLPPRDYLLSYEQWYLSLGFSSGYRWSTFMGIFGLGGGMRFGIIRNSYDADLYRPFDPALRAGNNMWTPKNSFWMSTSLDRRDIFYDPSRGFYFSERMGFYGIFDEEREHYMRSDSKAQYFYTLFNLPVTETWNFKCVLGMHVGLSFLFKQPGRNEDSKVPVIEDASKLSVDGMFVGRGWSSAYRNKGLLLLDSWMELRFPLVPGILAFDLFFDMAGVENEQGYYFASNSAGEANFTEENLRFSYGGGFRFTMPQFPIRISFAKRFSILDGGIKWEPGALFGGDEPYMGMDLVISFALSY
ncbi:MAG: outer membrane protein assembly factor BamA [Treponema sp.]|nr:outer membrane protein assembly factor BamA [Treponema sp.]